MCHHLQLLGSLPSGLHCPWTQWPAVDALTVEVKLCTILHVCVCVKSLQSCLTLCDTLECKPTRFLCPWDSPVKNARVSCHALLQGIFPTQVSCISCIWQVGSLPLCHLEAYAPSYSSKSLSQLDSGPCYSLQAIIKLTVQSHVDVTSCLPLSQKNVLVLTQEFFIQPPSIHIMPFAKSLVEINWC